MLERLERIAELPNVTLEQIGDFESHGKAYPMFLLRLGEPGPGKAAVMIDAGIHGDEPAGVEAALRFLEIDHANRDLLSRYHFTVFPCNNPTGYELDTRENADGIDLNRQFNIKKPVAEVAIIAAALQGRCFDLVFEMHEDIDSPGLYLYEISDDHAQYVGETVVAEARAMGCPINEGECIEGLPAAGGIIRPGRARRFRKTRLPLAIFAYRTCGGHVITMEPPASKLPLEKRAMIELLGLSIALECVAKV